MKNYTIILSMVCLASLTGCSEQNNLPSANSPDPGKSSSNHGATLKLEFGEPDPEGTPPPAIKLPRLAPVATSAPALIVPEGTTLLSKGKKVSSSDDLIFVGDLSYITDGKKDGFQGYFVEIADGLQWVQIDLEQEAHLAAIWMSHTNGQPRAYHDVIVQVSNDPSFEKGVTTLFNNDYDNTAKFGKGRDQPYVETKFGKLVDAKQSKARYVRLYSNGSTYNDQNVYIEVEVYGIPSS